MSVCCRLLNAHNARWWLRILPVPKLLQKKTQLSTPRNESGRDVACHEARCCTTQTLDSVKDGGWVGG